MCESPEEAENIVVTEFGVWINGGWKSMPCNIPLPPNTNMANASGELTKIFYKEQEKLN